MPNTQYSGWQDILLLWFNDNVLRMCNETGLQANFFRLVAEVQQTVYLALFVYDLFFTKTEREKRAKKDGGNSSLESPSSSQRWLLKLCFNWISPNSQWFPGTCHRSILSDFLCLWEQNVECKIQNAECRTWKRWDVFYFILAMLLLLPQISFFIRKMINQQSTTTNEKKIINLISK